MQETDYLGVEYSYCAMTGTGVLELRPTNLAMARVRVRVRVRTVPMLRVPVKLSIALLCSKIRYLMHKVRYLNRCFYMKSILP